MRTYRAFVLFLALGFPIVLSAQTPEAHVAAQHKHTVKVGKGNQKVAHLAKRVAVTSVIDGAAGVEAAIDDTGVALQIFADGLDMFVAAPLEAMPKPFMYIGRGVHVVYRGLDFVGQKLAQ